MDIWRNEYPDVFQRGKGGLVRQNKDGRRNNSSIPENKIISPLNRPVLLRPVSSCKGIGHTMFLTTIAAWIDTGVTRLIGHQRP